MNTATNPESAEADARSPWALSHRADPVARDLADRHYNLQKPGTPQFVPPGRCAVFLTPCALPLWTPPRPDVGREPPGPDGRIWSGLLWRWCSWAEHDAAVAAARGAS